VADLRELLTSLKTGDLSRLEGQADCAIVSTIHKVKGMEFDDVVIVPSTAPFPFDGKYSLRQQQAEEEVRLWYVAMTRAKSRLAYAWSDRERAWQSGQPWQGTQTEKGKSILTGSLGELFISWAAYKEHNGRVIQDYIFRQVRVGNPVYIRYDGKIFHQKEPIGFLVKEKKLAYIGEAEVVAVYRFAVSPDAPFFKNAPPRYAYDKLTSEVRKQGWHYVVLVAGGQG